MQGLHHFGGHPSGDNRQRREQKRNESPFAGVCTVAVHVHPSGFRPRLAPEPLLGSAEGEAS